MSDLWFWDLDAFFERSKRCGFCPPDLPSFEEQCVAADEKLFNQILRNPSHTLHFLLPQTSEASRHYSLRHRTHNLILPKHTGHLTDSNFIIRNLYINIYWSFVFEHYNSYYHCYSHCRPICIFLRVLYLQFAKYF